jgi:hypothetical protein
MCADFVQVVAGSSNLLPMVNVMEPHYRSPNQSEKCWKQAANVALCLVIFLLVGYGIERVADAPDFVGLFEHSVMPGPRVETIGRPIDLVDYRFDLHQAGNRVQATFVLANRGDRQVRDLVIACELYDRSGEKRGVDRWVIYDTLAAESEGRYVLEEQRYVSHQVDPDAVTCRIVDVHGPSRPLLVHHRGPLHD